VQRKSSTTIVATLAAKTGLEGAIYFLSGTRSITIFSLRSVIFDSLSFSSKGLALVGCFFGSFAREMKELCSEMLFDGLPCLTVAKVRVLLG